MLPPNKYVHVLTGDECFFVININTFQNSQYFLSKYTINKSYGSCFNPIFLQNITGIQFDAILKYVQCKNDNIDLIANQIIKLLKTSTKPQNNPNTIFCNKFIEVIDALQLPKNQYILQQLHANNL